MYQLMFIFAFKCGVHFEGLEKEVTRGNTLRTNVCFQFLIFQLKNEVKCNFFSKKGV